MPAAEEEVAFRDYFNNAMVGFPTEGRIVVDSYDLNAFRDSGLHWLYLKWALEDHTLTGPAARPPVFATSAPTKSTASRRDDKPPEIQRRRTRPEGRVPRHNWRVVSRASRRLPAFASRPIHTRRM